MKRQIATFILALLAVAAWQALSADALMAQDDSPTARDGEPAAGDGEPAAGDGEPAADDGEPTEVEIRGLLVKESIARYTERWGRRQTYLRLQKCEDSSGYIRLGGPALICNPDDVTSEMIEAHRKSRKDQNSTFLNEPQPKF